MISKPEITNRLDNIVLTVLILIIVQVKKFEQFLILWLVNVVLLYAATILFPENYTLGNSIFSDWQAAVFSGFVWNYAIWNLVPMLKEYDLKFEGKNALMLVYLAANFVTLWLIARFSFMTGYGIGSWMYVLGLAVVANFVQFFAWQATAKKK